MTATSKVPDPRHAALGVRAHSGWAAAILLTGPVAAPQILERRRIPLCDPAMEGSKQPFHHAEPMDFPAAERFIARCTKSTDDHARSEITALAAVAAAHRCELIGCGILASSGRTLPDIASVLASHSLIHAAEGEFYRDAIARACEREMVAVSRVKERDVESWTAARVGEHTLRSTMTAFGKALGPPWTADQKLATMIAWLVLASRQS
jgi:hypothetical protein